MRPAQVTDTDILLPLSAVPPESLKIGVQSLQGDPSPTATPGFGTAIAGPIVWEWIAGAIARKWSARQWRTRKWSARQWSARQWSARQWTGKDSAVLTLDTIYRGVESNATPFIVRPTIQRLQVNQTPGLDDDPRSAIFELTTDLPVQMGQRILLCLNERSIDQPSAYVFEGDRLSEPSTTLIFRTQGLKPGDYLVRLQVDGAESICRWTKIPKAPPLSNTLAPAIRFPNEDRKGILDFGFWTSS